MKAKEFRTFGPDDGDTVLVRANPYAVTQMEGYEGTPIMVRSCDDYSGGASAYLTIENAKQLAQHLLDAVEFLENS